MFALFSKQPLRNTPPSPQFQLSSCLRRMILKESLGLKLSKASSSSCSCSSTTYIIKFVCVFLWARCRAIGAEDFIIKPIRASHLQKLRSYAMPPEVPVPKSAGTKRKLPPDLEVITEGNDATRLPHLAGVAVA